MVAGRRGQTGTPCLRRKGKECIQYGVGEQDNGKKEKGQEDERGGEEEKDEWDR